MAVFNATTRELVLKIVYYGPALCGKTTNLEYIYRSMPQDKKGKMLSLATESDRTLFFDFLPLELGKIQGWNVRIQLYTVPGQVFYDATRRLVLKGADSVVFVVDSQREMLQADLESLMNMKENLKANGLDYESIPMVIQYNKRDLRNILPIEELDQRLNSRRVPFFSAIAIRGEGVMETLKAVTRITIASIQTRLLGAESMPAQKETPAQSPAPFPPPTPQPTQEVEKHETIPAEDFDQIEELEPLEEIEELDKPPMAGSLSMEPLQAEDNQQEENFPDAPLTQSPPEELVHVTEALENSLQSEKSPHPPEEKTIVSPPADPTLTAKEHKNVEPETIIIEDKQSADTPSEAESKDIQLEAAEPVQVSIEPVKDGFFVTITLNLKINISEVSKRLKRKENSV